MYHSNVFCYNNRNNNKFCISYKLSSIILALAPLTLFLIFFSIYNIKNLHQFQKKNTKKLMVLLKKYYIIYKQFVLLEIQNMKGKDLIIKQIQFLLIYPHIQLLLCYFLWQKNNFSKRNNYNNMENSFQVGHILFVILSMNTAVWSISNITPNLKIIVDAVNSFQINTSTIK